jgi:TolA-binding protein
MSSNTDLKENILASKLEGVVQWIVNHRSRVLTGGGVALAAILISSVFILQRSDQTKIDWTRLSQAQALLSMKKYPEAEKIYTEVRNSTPDLDAKFYATFYLGQAALDQNKWDDAIARFSETTSEAIKHPIRPLAMSNLGFSYEQKGDYANAAQTYRQFMAEYAEHFLAPRVQLSLGRSLASAGDIPGAQEALGHLIDLYPTSPWAENARQIMDKFKTR